MAKWFVDAAKALRKDVDGRERGNRNSYGRMADAKDEGLLGVVSAPSALRWRCAALRLRETMVDDGRSRAGEAGRRSTDAQELAQIFLADISRLPGHERAGWQAPAMTQELLFS